MDSGNIPQIVFREANFGTDVLLACNTPIGEDGLPKRVRGLLSDWCVTTDGHLQCASDADLAQIFDLGEGRLGAIEDYLRSRKLRLREDDESLSGRIAEIYGHVRRGPVELLALQLRQLNILMMKPTAAEVIELMKSGLDGITTLGHFDQLPREWLYSFFSRLPNPSDRIATARWLEGMLQMAGIHLSH